MNFENVVNRFISLKVHSIKNDSNKMFIWFELRKMELVGKKEKLVDVTLAPCIYKKR